MRRYIVYKAVSPSGKAYIGITSRKLEHRIKCHEWEAKKGNKRKFYKAIRKYEGKIKWFIIETNLTRFKAIKLEQFYIQKFDSYKNGYNSSLGGDGSGEFKRTKETIEKNRQQALRRCKDPKVRERLSNQAKNYWENNPEKKKEFAERMYKYRKKNRKKINKILGSFEYRLENSRRNGGKPINVYDYKTKIFIKRFEIISDAARELGVHTSKIVMCLRNERNHTHGYAFEYVNR